MVSLSTNVPSQSKMTPLIFIILSFLSELHRSHVGNAVAAQRWNDGHLIVRHSKVPLIDESNGALKNDLTESCEIVLAFVFAKERNAKAFCHSSTSEFEQVVLAAGEVSSLNLLCRLYVR